MGGQHRDGVPAPLVLLHQTDERIAVEQRSVRTGDNNGTVQRHAVGHKALQRALNGAACAWNLILIGDEDGGIHRHGLLHNAVAFVADDDDEPVRVERAARVDGVAEQGTPRNRVQDLRGARFHPPAARTTTAAGGFFTGAPLPLES